MSKHPGSRFSETGEGEGGVWRGHTAVGRGRSRLPTTPGRAIPRPRPHRFLQGRQLQASRDLEERPMIDGRGRAIAEARVLVGLREA